MKTIKHLPSMLSIVFVLACFNVLVLGQSNENRFANITSIGSGVRFDVGAPHASVTLTVIGPDGVAFSKEFKSGNSPEFRLISTKGERLPDGQYTYELRVTPNISSETKDALKAAREKGNTDEVTRELRKRGALPSESLVQSGSFLVANGSVILASGPEERVAKALAPTERTFAPTVNAHVSSGRTNYKVVRHHPRFMVFTQVIPDDLVVQGSICAGIDCSSTESFGFDTIR